MVTQTELYRFTEKNSSSVWTYTSGNSTIAYDAGAGSEDYLPVSISRTAIEANGDLARANLDITVALDNAAALSWLNNNGINIVVLTIHERDKSGTYSIAWKGRLVEVIPGMSSITLKFESVFTSMKRPGLRARYQKNCRHGLYQRGCGLSAASFASAQTCTGATGRVLTVPGASGQPDGYYTGGMLAITGGALSFIVNHTGTLLTVQYLSAALQAAIAAAPFAVTLYPGCAHDRLTCDSKFNNLLNYGGFDFIPPKNPMKGSSIV